MLNKKLILKKTHDFCQVKEPKLTVVMIHGIAADSSSFNNALSYLEGTVSLKKVRFVTFDLLGAGKSLKDDKLNYDFKEQIEALHNAIEKLKAKTPLVLIGHSLGTFIVTKYADTYKKSIQKLILISPPIYTESDLKSPAFQLGIKMFKDILSAKDKSLLQEKAFNNSMENIVLNKRNYKTLAGLKTKTILIYGELDQLIATYNIPKILKDNPKYITAIATNGKHGITRDKYTKLVDILGDILNA